MDKILEYAKAVVGAVVAAVALALAGVDWQAVIAGALAGGIGVGATPNKRRAGR